MKNGLHPTLLVDAALLIVPIGMNTVMGALFLTVWALEAPAWRWPRAQSRTRKEQPATTTNNSKKQPKQSGEPRHAGTQNQSSQQ